MKMMKGPKAGASGDVFPAYVSPAPEAPVHVSPAEVSPAEESPAQVSTPHAECLKQKLKKNPVKFDRGQEDLKLDFMEGNDCLWNPGHGDWMKADIKEKAWNMIGSILECDGSDVRIWWNTNKDRYVREHKEWLRKQSFKCKNGLANDTSELLQPGCHTSSKACGVSKRKYCRERGM